MGPLADGIRTVNEMQIRNPIYYGSYTLRNGSDRLNYQYAHTEQPRYDNGGYATSAAKDAELLHRIAPIPRIQSSYLMA